MHVKRTGNSRQGGDQEIAFTPLNAPKSADRDPGLPSKLAVAYLSLFSQTSNLISDLPGFFFELWPHQPGFIRFQLSWEPTL